MKAYELSVLFHPDLEMNLDPALAKVKKLIESNGGKITKEEPEGKKRMNYQIKGNEYALYYYFDVELPADSLNKLSTSLGINDEVIRFLIVKHDPRREKYAAILKAKEAEAAAESDSTKEAKTVEETKEAKEEEV